MAVLRALGWICTGLVSGAFSLWWVTLLLVSSGFFGRYSYRTLESECRTNLNAWFTAEKAWYGERFEYATDFHTIGFAPEQTNRYLYTADPLGVTVRPEDLEARQHAHQGLRPAACRPLVKPADVPARVAGNAQVGVTGICPNCEATAVCVAQLDDDEEVDVWSISTANRFDDTGEEIAAGVPFHDRSDRHPAPRSRLVGWFR